MNLETIRAKIRYLLGDITSDSYSDTNIDRAINDYYHKALGIAFTTCGEWEVSGEVSTTNLVATQQEYVLPSNIISLYKVEANFTGNSGDWVNLPIANMTSINSPLSNETTNTTSSFCRVFDNSLFLEYPAGSSITAGLKVWFVEDITELSNTTDAPDLPEYLISYIVDGACIDYTIRTSNSDDLKKFRGSLSRDKKDIKEYYSKRLPAIRTRITGNKESYK